MRRLRFVWVDVFAERPLAGNGLCVVLAAELLDPAEMQALAAETRQSETTFVLPPTDPRATYRVRIFTPQRELPFAGHPTLGTAAALVAVGAVPGPRLVQESAAGLTPVEVSGGRAVMEAPAPRLVAAVDPRRLAEAVGVPVEEPEVIVAGIAHLVARVPSPAQLAATAPDAACLTALSREWGFVGACLWAGTAADGTLRARVFAPAVGVPEDPATGSAAAPLALYLHRRGLLPAQPFTYVQGAELGRPSSLWVAAAPAGDGGGGSLAVRVGGPVVVLGEGEFRLP